MASVILNGDTSGSVTISPPAVAGTQTVTLPAASGVLQVSGNMPAFSVWQANSQTIPNGVYTKVIFDTEEFDTNNNFASNRFTPTVAGYYAITAYLELSPTVEILPAIYKNGTQYKRFLYNTNATSSGFNMWGGTISSIYMNGSTDYIELYVYQSSAGTSKNTGANQQTTYMTGTMTRAA